MDYLSLLAIAVGLAMDAFAVSISTGATYKKCNNKQILTVAGTFAIFQTLMPVIGWVCGTAFASIIESVDHWIAFALLLYLGISMIIGAVKNKEEDNIVKVDNDFLPLKTLITMAIATSIDALATGVILPNAIGATTATLMIVSVAIIGIITLIICYYGVIIGKKFGTLFQKKAEILGGIVLVAIGVKILIEHLFFS